MSEENTERLDGSTPFEVRVLRELANLNRRFDGLEVRLTNLEEKVDARSQETRPIWEAVLLRLDKIETRLDKMDTKFDVIGAELHWTYAATLKCLRSVLRPLEAALRPDE